ncbi:SHOCT-like domain-containing protein [[Clostridium] colinum]|uniref:SHOCT-like domain-containing protein n=1 Tax=[Clostridium] colinum TaxID=36835 RepID=UPI0020250455|nr:hypothetical protein [[Clostridium] colinum]
MTNERIMILEMVKENKISVDDGVKLLNAINKNSSSNFEDFKNDLKYKFDNMPKPDTTKIKQNTQAVFNKTEELFDEFAKSIKDFFNTSNTNNNTQNNDNNTTINVEPVEPENKENNTNNEDNNN